MVWRPSDGRQRNKTTRARALRCSIAGVRPYVSATQNDGVFEPSLRQRVLHVTLAIAESPSGRSIRGGVHSGPCRCERAPCGSARSYWKLLEREATREGVSKRGPVHPRRHDRAHRVRHGPAWRRRLRGRPSVASGTRPDAEAREKGTQRRQALLDAVAAVHRTPTDSTPCTQPDSSTLDVTPSFDRLARARRTRARRARGAGLTRGLRPSVLQELPRSARAVGLPAASPRSATPSVSMRSPAASRCWSTTPASTSSCATTSPSGTWASSPTRAFRLIDADGHALGTLCVIDSHPRHWTTHQVQLLSDIAASVVTEITLAGAATPSHEQLASRRSTSQCSWPTVTATP